MKPRQRPRTKFRYYDYQRVNRYKDSSSDEETELLVKDICKPKRHIPTIEVAVENDDTLQSIAIRYRCTIEDLKRLNNIHKENEIYARNTIKVPDHPFSAALAGVHSSGLNSPKSMESNSVLDLQALNEKIQKSVLNHSRTNSEVNEIIFNSNVSQKTCDTTLESSELVDHDDEVSLLPSSRHIVADSMVSRLSCSGIDGDISLFALLSCAMIVIFAIPLIYVLYIAEHPNDHVS